MENIMPPKVKIPREAIIEKAFELTKEYGFEKVTARLLASELKCSTQPVFHAFRNMEELKEEVYKRTQKLFEETMLQQPFDTETPYFLSMGLKYVELAQNEKNLFHLLCMSDSGTRLESLYDLAKHVPVPIEPEVFVKTWIFTHGIATIVSTNTTNIAPEEIRQLLIEAFWAAGWHWLSSITLFLAGAVIAVLLILLAIEAHQDKVLNDIAMRENNDLEKKYEIG